MELFNNPFYVLGASPRDGRKRIMELAEERSLVHDADACAAARSDLTNPRKRLAAEVGWLPGIRPQRARELLALLETAPQQLLGLEILAPLARANLLVAGLARLPELSADTAQWWLEAIVEAFEEVAPEDLAVVLNGERVAAGFPEIADLSAVEDEMQDQRRLYLRVIMSRLEELPTKDLLAVVTNLVEKTTDGGEESAPVLVDELVDAYQVKVQSFFEKAETKIQALVDQLRNAVDAKRPDAELAPLVDKLIKVVKNWDTVAQPIQVSMRSRGTDHAASHSIARMVRDLAIDMYNKHGKLEFSRQLTDMLRSVFAEVDSVAEQALQDTAALLYVSKQREDWRKEITYEVDIRTGLFSKQVLRISPDGIEWRRKHWKLEDIIGIGWRVIQKRYEIIYEINWRTDYSSEKLKLYGNSHNVYTNFTEKLWKAVGYKILKTYLNELSSGKYNHYDLYGKRGYDVVRNNGILLNIDKKIFEKNEQRFFPWNEVDISSQYGEAWITSINNNKLYYMTFSYSEYNVVVLYTAINLMKEYGLSRLSDVLNIL